MENYYPNDFFNSVSKIQEQLAENKKPEKVSDVVKYETDKLFNIIKAQIGYNMYNRIILFNIPNDYNESIRKTVLRQVIDGFIINAKVFALFKISEYNNNDWFSKEEFQYYKYKEIANNFDIFPNELIGIKFCQAELFALEFNDHPTKIFNTYPDKIEIDIIDQYL